jgi:anti-anti-sigma regulatory factor
MSNSTARAKKRDLAYYIHDGPTTFRLQVSGDVSGDAVQDLEQTWRTASSAFGGRCLAVDLSSVTGMDRAGCELLEKWQVEGACIVVISTAAKIRIESMMDLPVTLLGMNPNPYRWPPFRLAPRWVAAFMVLLYPAAGGTVNRHRVNSTYLSFADSAGAPTPARSDGGCDRPSTR